MGVTGSGQISYVCCCCLNLEEIDKNQSSTPQTVGRCQRWVASIQPELVREVPLAFTPWSPLALTPSLFDSWFLPKSHTVL